MGKATIIRVDGSEEVLDHKPTLKEAQEIVGGFIELLKVPHNITLVLNEEGRIFSLPKNERASRLFSPWNLVGNVIVLEGWRTVG